MTREALFEIFLLVAPFLLYAAYVRLLERGRAARAAGHPAPWARLFAAGLVLALGGIVLIGLQDKHQDVNKIYNPHRDIPLRKVTP